MNRADYAAAAAQPRSEAMHLAPSQYNPGIAAGQSVKAPDSPPLVRTLGDLRHAQDLARDRLEMLASRLEPLLASPVPEPECGKAGRPSVSQFDAELMGRVDSASAMADRIDNLLRRLSI